MEKEQLEKELKATRKDITVWKIQSARQEGQLTAYKEIIDKLINRIQYD